jgi:hypothetical protein
MLLPTAAHSFAKYMSPLRPHNYSSPSTQVKCTICYGASLSLSLSLTPDLHALSHALHSLVCTPSSPSPVSASCRMCNLIIIVTIAGKYYKMRYVTGQFVPECAGVTVCRALSLCLSTGETSLCPTGTLKRALHSLSCPIARRSDIITPHLHPHYHHDHYHPCFSLLAARCPLLVSRCSLLAAHPERELVMQCSEQVLGDFGFILFIIIIISGIHHQPHHSYGSVSFSSTQPILRHRASCCPLVWFRFVAFRTVWFCLV